LHPTHRLVMVNLSAAMTHAGADDETAPGRVMESTFGVSADRCWQDPHEDLYVNHIYDIVKHAVETKDEPAGVQIHKLHLPLPVIVVGFPKSGTTSVWSFFRCAGIVAQHYCCCGDVSDRPPCYTHTFAECMLDNIGHNRSSPMQGCGEYPVYAQLDGERSYFDKVLRKQPQLFLSHYLPQHFLLDEIHNFAPTATYVLPLRDPMAWAESVNHWFNMQVRVSNEYRWYNVSMVTDLLPRNQKKDIARLPETQALELLAKLYQDHTDKVRAFVRQHPSHALVEFNITHHDAGQILANAFGLPSSCWVRKNKVLYWTAVRSLS
jgi:Sulfotransferase domain